MAKAEKKNSTAGGMPKEGAAENVTALDKLAVWITERVGTMVFFLIIFTWTIGWLLLEYVCAQEPALRPVSGIRALAFYLKYDSAVSDASAFDRAKPARGGEERAKKDLAVNLKAEKRFRRSGSSLRLS